VAFVLPFVRKVRFLTLAMCEAEVAEACVTRQAIALNVRAVIAFKVGNDEESIVNAARRFLSDQDQMSILTGVSSQATCGRSSGGCGLRDAHRVVVVCWRHSPRIEHAVATLRPWGSGSGSRRS
jgi:hypothetical protein